MSTGKLYEEAVSEAKDLVRMAEENAKNKLIDAFAPRIRRLVESKLLSEDDSDDVMDIVNSISDDADDAGDSDLSSEDTAPEEVAEETGEVGEDFDLEDYDDDDYDVDDGMDLHVPQGVKRVTFDLEEKKGKMNDMPVEMTSESVKTLLKIVDGRGNLRDRTKALRLETKVLRRALGALNGRRPNKQAADQIVEEFNAVLRKAIGLKQELKDSGPGSLAEAARNEFNNLLEEISEMSTRTLLRNLLAESNGMKGTRLFEAEEDEAGTEGGDDAGDMDMGGDDMDDDAGEEGGEVTLSPELVDMLRSALAGASAEDAGGDEDSEEESTEEEVDMEEEADMAEYDESAMFETEESDEKDVKEESFRRTRRDTVYSIDESMLRRELLRLRRLREEADPMVGSFANAEDQGDAFEDPTELNANVKEGDAPKRGESKSKAEEAAMTKEEEKEEAKNEARRFRLAAVQEARNNRALRARLAEAAKAVRALSGQLQEQKLFNAKLLYVNKLMQNRSLSDKQLRAVVEALDAAKTLREAKLLYTSLTESLTRGKPMTENANRTAGGSSRPTGSAGKLNESVGETDRWAILAGISK